MDESAPQKRHRIEIKVNEAQKNLIARGAAAAKQGISEFVRLAAERAAHDALSGPKAPG
jgi:uncharacterized protein (DUF1778 family)